AAGAAPAAGGGVRRPVSDAVVDRTSRAGDRLHRRSGQRIRPREHGFVSRGQWTWADGAERAARHLLRARAIAERHRPRRAIERDSRSGAIAEPVSLKLPPSPCWLWRASRRPP